MTTLQNATSHQKTSESPQSNPYPMLLKLAKTNELVIPGIKLGEQASLVACPRHHEIESQIMKSFRIYCLLLSIFCVGCGSKSTASNTTKTTKKTSSSSPSYRAPGPASAKRAAFNANGESLSSSSGVDELFIKDLDSSNTETVKAAIEQLQGNGVKSAIPKLETLAKSHKNSDIKKRAQAAVDSLKKRK